jgi:phage FluMu protein gp41
MSSNTVIKTLRKPWTVAGQKVTEVELREPTVKDFIEAEKDGNPNWAPNAYKAALAAQTMVRAGTFTGPFAPSQFGSMSGASWQTVVAGLVEAEALGEAEQPSQAQST